MRILLALLMLGLAAPALAQDTVEVPRERPPEEAVSAPPEVPLPRERPAEITPPSAPAADAAPLPAPPEPAASSSEEPASSSSEPPQDSKIVAEPPAPPKPPRDYQVACPAVMNGAVTGKNLPPILEGQCGLHSPLSIEAVTANGRSIPLNAPVITDCGMATAFPDWIAEVDSYLKAHDKTQISTINISTSYQCRNVNHATTGNLSFHGFGDALDVMGFDLEDGRTISIAPGFRGTPEQGSQILHFARDSACTHFMTVLSPDADAAHQDNMHLDLACHGKSCTSRMCQ